MVDVDWLLQHLQQPKSRRRRMMSRRTRGTIAVHLGGQPTRPKIFYFAKSSQIYKTSRRTIHRPSNKVEELTVNDVYEEWKNDDDIREYTLRHRLRCQCRQQIRLPGRSESHKKKTRFMNIHRNSYFPDQPQEFSTFSFFLTIIPNSFEAVICFVFDWYFTHSSELL